MSRPEKPWLSEPPSQHELLELLAWLDEAVSDHRDTLRGWLIERENCVLWLADEVGYGVKPAANQLDISPKRVRQLMESARERLGGGS